MSRRRRAARPAEREDRGIVSDADWKRPGVRHGLRAVQVLMLLFLLVVGL